MRTQRRWALAVLLAACKAVSAELELNTASQAKLEQVNGIGVTLSEQLLKARAQRPFEDWGDVLRRVPGIGPRTARRLSQQGLVVGGRAYVADAPAASASVPSSP